jgi:glycosyltransferase involved in cell wall biosynthesis
MPVPLSIIIIAKNEQMRIEECIKSVHGWADEIVVIDDDSSDNTKAIASKYTNKIFQRTMDLEGRQRNFGASQAANDWVMMLDCDERPTPELKKEIEELFKNLPEKTMAYWVGQICYVGDVHIKYGGWSNPHLRLYNRKHMAWSEAEHDVVHPGMKLAPGYIGGNLKSALVHYNYRNVEDIFHKVNRMSTLEALKWHLEGRKISQGKGLWRSIDRFFRRWIGKKGYKDGYIGFILSVSSGLYELLAYSKYREIKDKGHYLNYLKHKPGR